MSFLDRRQFIMLAGFSALSMKLRTAEAIESVGVCIMKESELSVESSDSPFFEHYHQLSIPITALVKAPESGLTIRTSPVDQGSYDREAFSAFVKSSGLKPKSLAQHTHDVVITKAQLERIASGVRNVEIRVISKNGNYVHNFFVTATPATLAKINRYAQGKLKI